MIILGIALLIFTGIASTGVYYYVSFGRMISARLSGQIFQNTSRVYSAPQRIFPGEAMKIGELESYLVRAGYAENGSEDAIGEFTLAGHAIEIHPSKNSYFEGGNAIRVDFGKSTITGIVTLPDSSGLTSAEIEPQVLTNLFDPPREKRRLVRFDDIPKPLIEAVLSAEDKRFFDHGGFDFVRVFGAALADVRRGQKAQGASTIDMQVARSFFFTTKRDWRRKIKETIVAVELDQRYSKQQILEL